ncbi:MAG TPA: hypothetical protein G4O08_08180 [Anaerolineae bacterium]|nr:hypothetical protein [Anaerolineae bacterium]
MDVNRYYGRIRRPVQREGAERYLLVTLISFAASVAATRLFLELTGYPQLGGGELHIAHVLWGGLLLFVAALLPLIFANRWAYLLGALGAGLGVGLFIDEVGKFITQTNDYFYPAAAPLVYAFFLLTVLVYLQVRRSHAHTPRAELYRALDGMQEVLDRDLDTEERQALEARLRFIAEHAKHPSFSRLSRELLDFICDDELALVPDVPSFWERILTWLQKFEVQWITLRRLRGMLVGGLVGLGVVQFLGVIRLIWAVRDPLSMERMLTDLVSMGKVTSASAMAWFIGRISLEGIVGLFLLGGALFLAVGKERLGERLAYYGLLVSLTVTNLLVFYFEQFSTIITASIQFLLLLGLIRYRRRYIGVRPIGKTDIAAE